jgi:cyclopropane fatty-acyl-phospholipid synthase-like methyltransferase
MANKLGIKPGEVVLDVGCGVGGPAREIAIFTDCNVVGLNNNDYQYATLLIKAHIVESNELEITLPSVICPTTLLLSRGIS